MKRSTASPKIVTTPPGPNTKKWANFHMKHAAQSTYEKEFVWDRHAPAIGPFCTDADGNVFMDFVSHVASSPFGYNHPKIIQVQEKLAKIDPDRYAGTDFMGAYGPDPKKCKIPTPSHLHYKIIEITKQFGFDTAFFINSGAEAVENAIKICYDHRRNYGYGITFTGAFHGRTLGALSLNRSKEVHRKWFPQIPKIIELPYCSCKGEECECEASTHNLANLVDPKKGLIEPKEIAFVMIEPIQGEGGYRVPNKKFIQEIGRVAKEKKIPLICDEIQAGLGRTGKWWGCENFGLKPDVVTAAKSLRIAATISRREMFPDEPGRISSTWGEGNAISSAIGYTIIDIIQKENLLENAQKMGRYFLNELSNLQKKYDFIEDVRGIGLMDAIELETKELRDKIVEKCIKKGLLIIGCGYKAIRFLPPLDVKKREIDIALEILNFVCAKI